MQWKIKSLLEFQTFEDYLLTSKNFSLDISWWLNFDTAFTLSSVKWSRVRFWPSYVAAVAEEKLCTCTHLLERRERPEKISYSVQKPQLYIYRTRAIITRGFYTFYSLFEDHLCTVTFGLLALCMVSIQERVIVARVRYTLWLSLSLGSQNS